MGGQCIRSGRSTMDCFQVRSSMNRGNQEMSKDISFENGLRNLRVKLDYITLKV